MKEEKNHPKIIEILLENHAPAHNGGTVRLEYFPQEIMGWVSSRNYAPSLGKGIALAYLERQHAKPGVKVIMESHGRQLSGVTVRTPFINKV